MKKLILSLFLLLCIATSSNAQTKNTTPNEFYSYLNTVLKNKSVKSIQLLGTNYATLGSKYKWEAQLKKNGNKIEIEYNSQVPNDDGENADLIVMHLDTTFVIARKHDLFTLEMT